MLKWLSVLAAALLVGLSPAHAQMTDQQRAQAYYFEAEASLADGKLKDADDLRAKAKEALGGDNAKLLFLEARIHFQNGTYEAANRAMQRFYEYNPGPNLSRDMSPYVVKIETKLEEARSAAAAAAVAEAEKRRAEELLAAQAALLDEAIEECVDTSSCASSSEKIQKFTEENGSFPPEFNDKVIAFSEKSCASGSEKNCKLAGAFHLKLCIDGRSVESCVAVSKNGQFTLEQRLAFLVFSCLELKHLESCRTRGEFLLHDTGYPAPLLRPLVKSSAEKDGLSSLASFHVACNGGDVFGCNRVIENYIFQREAGQVDKYSYRGQLDSACGKIGDVNGYYLHQAVADACAKRDFPARPIRTPAASELFLFVE